jgi:hypothetical protein
MTPLFSLVFGVACSTVDEPGPMDAGGAASGRVVHDHYRLWYRDFDGDGHGDPTITRRGLTRPDRYVANATDCDDRDRAVFENCAISVAEADLTVTIDQEERELGARMASGDLDGDGTADLAIGGIGGSSDGSVYLLYGPASGSVAADDLVSLTGSRTLGSHFGSAIGAGDANGDALDDLLVSDEYSEAYYLFLGPVTADGSPSDADAEFVEGLSFLGDECVAVTRDLDGDGGADLVMTSPHTGDGAVYVASGTTSGTLDLSSDATYTLRCSSIACAQFGLAMAEMGDTNGDGISDLASADPYTYPGGSVYFVHGGFASGSYDVADVATATITTSVNPTFLGISVAAGDYDGDGAADLFAGAWGADSYNGAVYGFLGPLSGVITPDDASTRWEPASSVFGAKVSADDFDGDGATDVAMGNNYGQVFVQLGYATGVVDEHTLVKIEGESIGRESMTPIRDWTGDGGSELALGSPYTDGPSTEDAGAVYVFFSESLQ